MIEEKTYEDYLQNLLEGNKERCEEIVESSLDQGVEIEELYTDLIQRSMYEVGNLWEIGEISVAKEHLATSITERILTSVYPEILSKKREGRSIIIACVVNEYHQIGGRMIADLFELFGWDSYFVGADTPIDDLLSMIEEKQPDVVGFSVAMERNLPELNEYIKKICDLYPDLEIIVGGQAFDDSRNGILNGRCKAEYISSIEELKERYDMSD